MAPCPVYPPGVLQTVTIPDPTSLDGFGELEITLIPSRGVTDINHFSEEGITAFKEMLYGADEDFRYMKFKGMCEIQDQMQMIEERAECIWQDNAFAVGGPQPPLWFEQDCKYGLPAPWNIRIALEEAEEDADYEEWINSKQYQDSLNDYNRHNLLAWDKESHRHPKWVGHSTGLELQHCGGFSDTELFNSYIKERYRVEVNVDELHWGKGGSYYAIGRTPYGDVYIPQKITEYLKDFCGLYKMDIALQDIEGAPGKKPNAFRWTCVYLHNKGFSLE